jgi:DNA-binding beta-propeller fold protein YncE
VENWDVNAPQTEEEAGESPEALSLELDWSRNILIANFHGYRVTRSRAPFPSAVRLYQSEEVHFRNLHVNAESGYATCDKNGCGTYLRVSKFPYEDAIEDVTHHLAVREREFAVLDIPKASARPAPPASAVLAPGVHVEKLEDGFYSISGAAVDSAGKLYFVDHHEQRIYGWSKTEGLTIERDHPLDAVNLGFDDAGDLMVVSSAGAAGTVYSFRPGTRDDQITVLEPRPSVAHAKGTFLLPVNYWINGEFKDQLDLNTYAFTTIPQMFAAEVTARKANEYVAPDGAVFLPAGRVFQQGPVNDASGWRFSDNLDTYGLLKARAGQAVFVSSESEDRTYSAVVQPDGSLGDLKRFTERGGECVAVDARGNVYVANGQIVVYSPAGKQVGEIDVPERPIDIVFGGLGGNTLFILSHHALFAAQVALQ